MCCTRYGPSRGQGVSLKLARQYLTAQGLTLVVRLILVGLLQHAPAIGGNEPIVLGLATTVTFSIKSPGI